MIFTPRACPPTHLQAAQFLRSAAYSQRNSLAAQFLLFLANRGGPRGGTQGLGPQRRVPQAPQGWPKGQGAQGALRAPWGGRAPSAPLGPIGAIGIIPKLFRMGLFYDFISRVGGKRGWTGRSPFSWPWTKLPNQSKVNDLGQGLNGEHFWCLRLEG